MPKRLVVTSVMVAFVLCAAHRAHAQSTWSDHARVSLNAGFQQPSTTFTATAHPPVYEGTATLTTNYTVPKGPLFDGGVILRLSGGFGIDIGVSSFSRSEVAPITGTIPHPVLGNAPRPIGGTSGSLERSEIVGRLDAAYVVSAGFVDLALSAGPSFFTVNQDLVTNVTFAESPSFDRVTFTGATVEAVEERRCRRDGALFACVYGVSAREYTGWRNRGRRRRAHRRRRASVLLIRTHPTVVSAFRRM